MFLIRADGNAKIGAGHLMRCLTIADALKGYVSGREILFVCADGQSAELAQSRGYRVFILGSDPQDMEAELSTWSEIPEINIKTNVILVDSYFVTKRYLREIRRYGAVTLLDDMGEECFPADRIINYNAFADKEHYESLYRGVGTELILGSAYVPVRPQFRGKPYRVRKNVENILITTGGGDVDNIAGQILKRLKGKTENKTTDDMITSDLGTLDVLAAESLNYHLIIGGFNPHYEEMKTLERQSANLHLHHNVQDMADLMSQCDLAVTAGGSTVYELAAVGVPFICFSYAENQEKITEYLHREKIAFSAGAYHREPEAVLERIAAQTAELIRDPDNRNECYFKERALVDGMGAERLAKLLATERHGKI